MRKHIEYKMNKTIIYLCRDTSQLKSLDLDIYFPETELHPISIPSLIPSLLGKSLCTHSEALINYLGHLIAEGEIKPEDIEINLITYDENINEWSTRKIMFDSEGYLIDWEIGYFGW